jgi:hypothetical protein
LRSVSAETPNLWAIEVIAAHYEGCSSWCSNTSLTARSRNSCGYLPGRVIAPPLTSQSLQKSRAGQPSVKRKLLVTAPTDFWHPTGCQGFLTLL